MRNLALVLLVAFFFSFDNGNVMAQSELFRLTIPEIPTIEIPKFIPIEIPQLNPEAMKEEIQNYMPKNGSNYRGIYVDTYSNGQNTTTTVIENSNGNVTVFSIPN
ncbi:uncharacterized protein LOC128676430 [Plodia interpunctella]|uniref:uncharacterized protein LOC128676430 n=1 Tax=Plodia interpunctella TaxID=58824 RepID=UPI002367D2D1|nr:uncharacterized protein LOC128676430 [Plodia interpunctella]